MRQQEYENRISELLARFYAEVKIHSAITRTDLFKVSESCLKPILSLIFNLNNLQNLNVSEHVNFPAIDLGDKDAKIAFQITAESNLSKIKETLQKFIKNQLYNDYHRLIIYILTERQKTYSMQGLSEIINGRIEFSEDRDVIDYRYIQKWGESQDLNNIQRLNDLLEKQFGDTKRAPIIAAPFEKTETVYFNLLEVSFPETIYVADLVLDDIKESRSDKKRGPTMRDKVWMTLKRRDGKAPSDWVTHSNQIITFHNLEEPSPFEAIIDKGSVVPLSPDEYYSASDDLENVFKSLPIKQCLQQKLYQDSVLWYFREKLFVFCPKDQDSNERVIAWKGLREANRTVYEKVFKKKKSDEVLCHKHFAFDA